MSFSPAATRPLEPGPQVLRQQFTQLRRDGLRQRDIAQQLGVSEAALLAAHTQHSDASLQATALQPDWAGLMGRLESLGELMALTRNAACVHEKVGVYRKASHNANVGLVLGADIDLRLFYKHWRWGFAVQDCSGKTAQHSLQFFDEQGQAVHKVFLRQNSDHGAYAALVQHYAAPELSTAQPPALAPDAAAQPEPECPDTQVDVLAFRQAWRDLRDTHEFFGLLKTHGLSRTQALRLAEPQFAQRLSPDCALPLLQRGAQNSVPLMVFVGNRGIIQIHSGAVQRITVLGPWVNVLDPGFNLHLRADHIAQAWLVRKPTSDGVVSSLELFDSHGQVIAMFFGVRKPGEPERQDWRALLQSMPAAQQEAA
ncbi:hemin-degrading factor [Roseateles sp. BYS180W]|uniref:Hemin-degrading factor n=1 Tax=Roseateles rivi TaxID=3299028 RepID=A0ABW7FXZ4_9BURK